jgi:predicted nucleotidyltransferase
MISKGLRNKLSSNLACQSGLLLAYLFGSQIEGRLGPVSDYDLAVFIDPDVDGQQFQARLAHELAQVLQGRRVDVVLLNRAPIELAYAAIAQGKLLYERDIAARVEYEAGVLGRYGDYLPVLRAQRADIVQGDEYGHRVQRYRAALGRTERTLGQIAAFRRQGSL